MKTCIDHNKINWFAQLSNIASIGGLVLLLGSVLLPLFFPKLANYALWMMILGLGVAMVGIYFANRWVKKPRPEAVLDKALKSLTDTYHLFHYPALPSDHILLTPNGVVLLETINLSGSFSYKDGRWKESMSIGRALRFIVEEHLGDPIKSTRLAEKTLRGKLAQEITASASIPIKSIIVFTHPAVLMDIKDAPIPVCQAEKLRKLVAIDAPKLEEEVYERLDTFFISCTRGEK